jgi:glycosyltransferase involved in cell wall biosynthesis
MRLLHITATHLNPAGGVPVVLKKLVEEQNLINGFTARVLSVRAETKQMESLYFDELGSKTFREYIGDFKPDICILHSFYYVEYNNIIKELQRQHIPYLIEPHGSFGHAAMQKSKIKKIIANNTIFRGQIKKAIGYVFLNEEEKKDTIYHKDYEIVIPNGIETDTINHDVKCGEVFSFYFIGRYDINHKGLDYLLDALDILEKKKTVIMISFWGSGTTEVVSQITNRVNQYKYVKVNVHKPVFGIEKDKLLEQIGPMLLTSRYEGFPMTVLEAWAYGNPCLVTPGTNVKQEVVDYSLGWGVNLSAESIAKGILEAVKEYKLKREDYINRCKVYVSKNYSWKTIALVSYREISNILSKVK